MTALVDLITAVLYGEITLKGGRVEQANFDSYQMLRINEVPAIEVRTTVSSRRAGLAKPGPHGSASRHQRDIRGNWQAQKLPVDAIALKQLMRVDHRRDASKLDMMEFESGLNTLSQGDVT